MELFIVFFYYYLLFVIFSKITVFTKIFSRCCKIWSLF